VVIIGAGIVGGMTARELARYKLRICLLEKENDVAMGATKANSAIVHAGFDAHEGSLKAKLNVRGSEMMEKVTDELGVKYRRNGSLVLAFNDEDMETVKELYARGNENGVKDLKVLSGDEVRTMEPAISDNVVGALYAPTGAIVCPYELNIASVGNAMDNGVELKRNFEVIGIDKEADGFVVRSATESVKARYVVNAAGVQSDDIAKLAGDNSFSIMPRRGEYLLFDKECGNTVNCTIFRTPSKMGKGILVTPTVDGNLLLGPTAENIEDKEDHSTTAPGLSGVMKNAAEVLKVVPGGKTITSFCGLRATGSTGDFIINNPSHGFVNAAGVESPGLSSAPAIAEYVVELIEKSGEVLVPNPDFNPIRKPAHYFRELSLEEKNEIIARDPAYAHIICRCEMVSEGEIVEAIRQNPKPRDLDAVKRRTRSGMGRCQGGFCSPYIVEILARELGIDYTEVTKFGGESYINVGKTKEV
jgi:glycerol-3-phosphate dehydrogenase